MAATGVEKDDLAVTSESRPLAYWGISGFLGIWAVLILLGQTTALFAYDVAVSLGLQEPVSRVGQYGVQVNRAFGVSDTVVLLPLIVITLVGLRGRRRWALPLTAAAMAISVYWSVTSVAMFVLLSGVPGYTFVPGLDYWMVLGANIAIGLWGVVYVVRHGDRLVDQQAVGSGSDPA